MTNNKMKKRKIKVGTVYLVDSFAAVRVKIKATRKDIDPFTKKDVWWGVLIDEADAIALQNSGVPYSKINIDESIIFDWQIVKSIRKKSGNSSKNASTIRKHEPKRKRRRYTVRSGSN